MNRTPSRLTRLALIAAAGVALLAAVPALAQQDHHHEGGGGHGGGGEHGGGGQPHGTPGGQQRGGGPWARGPSPGGGQGPSPGPRYQQPYNSYTAPPRYYQAPAPQRPSYQAPYRSRWLRGGYLPPSYQSYVIGEYWRFNLRRPPYGYEWVQVGPEYLLVSVSTGMIFDVVPAY